jgi:hypothetical protein
LMVVAGVVIMGTSTTFYPSGFEVSQRWSGSGAISVEK